MRKLFVLVLITVVMMTAKAQTAEKDTTIERIKIRTSFAKSYFGLDAFNTFGGTTQYSSPAGLQTVSFSGTTAARILLGGTHFWGHADFYVAIPVTRLGGQVPTELKNIFYGEGVETGFRVYPWAVEPGKLRPFVGVAFKGAAFEQVDLEPNKTYQSVPSVARTVFPYQAGLVFAGKQFLLQAGLNYQRKNDYRYPISRTEYGNVKTAPWSFNVGMSYWINSNGGLVSNYGLSYMKKGVKKLAANNRLNCWYLGVGPSGTFEISKSEYVKDKYPFLRQESPGTFIPDVTAGRYFHRLDINVGVSYRRLRYESSGYDVKLNYNRRSIMLESYKFLGDYHGFVPYVGPTLAYENLTFMDTDGESIKTFVTKKAALGVIFGWDIRVSRSETWLLRTNLRYTPNLQLEAEGKKVMFDQMEFNFIQLIWFAGRGKALRGT